MARFDGPDDGRWGGGPVDHSSDVAWLRRDLVARRSLVAGWAVAIPSKDHSCDVIAQNVARYTRDVAEAEIALSEAITRVRPLLVDAVESAEAEVAARTGWRRNNAQRKLDAARAALAEIDASTTG